MALELKTIVFLLFFGLIIWAIIRERRSYNKLSKNSKKDYWYILKKYYVYFIFSFLFLVLWIFFNSIWYKLFFGIFLIVPWIIEGIKESKK